MFMICKALSLYIQAIVVNHLKLESQVFKNTNTYNDHCCKDLFSDYLDSWKNQVVIVLGPIFQLFKIVLIVDNRTTFT